MWETPVTNQPTDMHGPASAAPNVTNKYATCAVCGSTWQVRSFVNTDAKGCAFCGAGGSAVRVHDEGPRS